MKQKQTEPEQQRVQHQTVDKESAPEAGKQTTSPGAQFDTHPNAHLWQTQRAFGNRYTQKLVQNSPPIQARFTSDSQNDMSESEVTQTASETIQKKGNRTGLPDNLKSGIENLSGYSLDDVTVHYNSSKPAQLQAHAYAQGTEIHVASGQEKHLPHEGWHVVQQAQGRVKPTLQTMGEAINDDAALEQEADVMGARANQIGMEGIEKLYTKVSIQKQAAHTPACTCSACLRRVDRPKDKRSIAIQNIYNPIRGFCSNWTKPYVKGNQGVWTLILPKNQPNLVVEKIMLRQKRPLSTRFFKGTVRPAPFSAT